MPSPTSMWRAAALAVLACATIACGIPLPADKAAFAGEWRGEHTLLVISADGRVVYELVRPGESKKLDLPLQSFEGNQFSAGLGPLSSTFVVNAPPRQVAGVWTMTVDGVALVRQGQ